MTIQPITFELCVNVSERMRDHLIKQKHRASNVTNLPNGTVSSFCAYRGQNGTMCAVGCLIDDAHYNAEMERMSAGTDKVSTGVAKSLNISLDREFVDVAEERRINAFISMMDEWQSFHDQYEDGATISEAAVNCEHTQVVNRLKNRFERMVAA